MNRVPKDEGPLRARRGRERDGPVAERVVWAGLGALVAVGVVVGGWAAFAPRSFYDDFPFGRAWVAVDGPYNEHLVRDFGDLNLALTAVTVVAMVTMGRAVVVAAAAGWLVYQVPHLVYHLRHLDVYDTVDQVANVVTLVGSVALPLVVLAAERARPSPE